jgi:hypothetical protein
MSSVEEAVVLGNADGSRSPAPTQVKNIVRVVRSRLAWLGFMGTTLAIYVGWIGRHERNITAENGLGYALGILGASMMAALLLYPLRKRFPSLRVIGSTRSWFLAHMLLGIVGPVLILYHSNFSVGSLNSRVALFCTLLVAGSGLVGRYLYAQIHHGLYGEKSSLRSLIEEMQQSLANIIITGSVIEDFLEQLAALDSEVLQPPSDVLQSAVRPFSFAFRTRWIYLRMSMKLRENMVGKGVSAGSLNQEEKKQVQVVRRDLRRHFSQVRKVVHLSFFERLFSLWHILHLPFFFMLVISAVLHIIAVHMY